MDYSNKIITNILGKKKKIEDYDNDGVPDSKDCQPKNTMRQDTIASSGIRKLQTRL